MTMFYHKTLDYIDIMAMYAFDRKNKLLKIYHSCCFKTCVIIADKQIPKLKKNHKKKPKGKQKSTHPLAKLTKQNKQNKSKP